jgi:purine nucleoside permease
MNPPKTSTLFFLFATLAAFSSGALAADPIPVKVAVIAMYELGEVTGDAPGEYQFWVEREALNRVYAFPFGPHDLRMNDKGLMGVCSGPGVSNAAMVISALGLDTRFDFSRTYWIVSGIAGGDPADVSIGSAAWSRWVVDGDLTHAIDSREAPGDWPYGLFPSNSKVPNELGDGWTFPNMAFRLNPQLVQWAYDLSKDVALTEHPEVVEIRKLYKGLPNAAGPPRVMLGESLGTNAYWHGEVLTQWANEWVKLYTRGEGNFVMTNTEDNGTLRALLRLASIRKVDFDRVLVLRTASNYSHQPPGKSSVWSLTAPYPANGLTALESCYRVARPVVHALIENWDT